MLVGQGLEQRGLHDPVQPVETVNVPGRQVVLDDAPPLGPVGVDDGVVVLVEQTGPALGFTAHGVGGFLGPDHRFGYPEADGAVGTAFSAGDLAVIVEHGDLIAEETRRLGAGVRDQCLVVRQFQGEIIAQEYRQALFDLLGFGLGSDEPEQGVVAVPDIAQPPIAGIARIPAGHGPQLLAQLPRLRVVATPVCPVPGGAHPGIGGVLLADPPSGVFRDQNRFDKRVQPVQVNIREDG